MATKHPALARAEKAYRELVKIEPHEAGTPDVKRRVDVLRRFFALPGDHMTTEEKARNRAEEMFG